MRLRGEEVGKMKLKLINRNFEINKNRININGFKKEDILIGVSFNKKQMKIKDYKKMLLYIFMPYKWLNKQFVKGKI